jgi:hypothetical protein
MIFTFMKELRADIEINAPTGKVWKVVTGFSKYPDWNPFIVMMTGELKVGNLFDVTVAPPGKKETRFRSKVMRIETGSEMAFHGKIMGGLLSDDHVFKCESISGDRTRFSQVLIFRGILLPMAGGTVKASGKGLEQMNQAMKVICEGK